MRIVGGIALVFLGLVWISAHLVQMERGEAATDRSFDIVVSAGMVVLGTAILISEVWS